MTEPALLQRLPHRAPMALIDRIVEIDERDGRLCAMTAPLGAHPQLVGTFRGNAAEWPPLLSLEAWCQAAGLLLIAGRPVTRELSAVLITRVADVKFRGRADAASALTMHVARTARYDIAEQFEGTVHSTSGACIASIGSLTATVRPIDTLSDRR